MTRIYGPPMANIPSPFLASVRAAIVSADGTLTYIGTKLFQDWDTRLTNGLNLIGEFIGSLSASVQISGRAGTIGTVLQHIDGTGVLAATAISGTLPSGHLPTPAIGAIGGVQANNPIPHQWVNSIDTSGIPNLSQPGYGDIAGTPTLPSDAPATPHSWVNSYTAATGAFTESQPAFSDISGAAVAAQIPALSALSGAITAGQLPAAGISATITTAKLTVGGVQGSMTFTNGILTAQVQAT
jgi:hypothetical protein